jgi:anaerobic magnesium-protoporphyrin IX monomethyl ester cyclase
MKIILVQPKIGYMDALRSAPAPPLGLLYAASKLTEAYEVELIDARLTDNLEGRLHEALTPDTLFVGVTSHTGPMIQSALHVSRLVKQLSGGVVVWGGVHASLAPEVTAADPAVDICVVGEGELTALELARALEAGRALDSVDGLVFEKNGRIVRTGIREPLAPEHWSEPAWELVDLSGYLPNYGGRRTLYYQLTRGCLHNCAYCYNVPFNHRRYRMPDHEVALDRLRRLRERVNFQELYFVDDNFFVDVEWSERISEGLSDLRVTWQLQGVDIGALLRMDRKVINRLFEQGCRRLTLGVETGSNRLRRLIRKQGTRDDVVRAIERFENSGILVFTSYMVGLPTETLEEIRETVNLALELVNRFDFVRCSPFYCYTPFPGTDCYKMAVQEGFLPPDSLEDWAKIGGWDYLTWERRSGDRVLGRRFFEGLNMSTLFIDRKIGDYSASKLMRLLFWAYRPVARLRARHLFFHLMPERWLMNRFYSHLLRER